MSIPRQRDARKRLQAIIRDHHAELAKHPHPHNFKKRDGSQQTLLDFAKFCECNWSGYGIKKVIEIIGERILK